jgi:2-polyprenyl-3-methyl-5-hydroxy-6-metoxy-1,4-benzoquinol methylase
VLSSLAELEGKLQEIDEAWAISDDAMREVFQGFTMAPPTDIPADPFSPEYAERQFEIYRLISERPVYEIENERCDFPTDANRPFPYYTESSETVGHQLMAIGFIIKSMGLRPGSSILELGPGWGNTTIELARMGYDVTAIDIDPAFVELISERAEKFSLSVDSRRGTFLEIDQLQRKFDAVLFFECFHHCSDHRDLVRKLADVIEPGGRVFFAAEPIADSFPMPWGVRTDGESLWAIRRNGWLELGFQESYFLRMLARLGWIADKHVTEATHLGVILEARRANGVYELATFVLPPDEDATWAAPDGPGVRQRYTSGHSVLSVEKGGEYRSIVIEAVSPCPAEVPYRVRHGREVASGTAPPGAEFTIRLPYDPTADAVEFEVDAWRPADLMQSDDAREIGIGVRTITLL